MNKIDIFKKIKSFLRFFPWLIVSAVCLPFIFLRPRRLKKVLVFCPRLIGDFVTQTPVLRELKTAGCGVSVVIFDQALSSLLKCDPNVERVIFWDIKASRFKKLGFFWKILSGGYDASINLSSESWCDFLSVDAFIPRRVSLVSSGIEAELGFFFKAFGFKTIGYEKGSYSSDVYLRSLRCLGLEYKDNGRYVVVCKEDEDFIKELYERMGFNQARYLVGISHSCGNKLKEWDKENFAVLADSLIERLEARVLFTGSIADKNRTALIISLMKNKPADLSGFLILGQFAALCKRLNLFISVDSGPLYIANALGTPVIDIAGPIDYKEQLRLDGKTAIVQSKIDCVPCSYVADTARKCRRGRRECLESIKPRDVFDKAWEILRK